MPCHAGFPPPSPTKQVSIRNRIFGPFRSLGEGGGRGRTNKMPPAWPSVLKIAPPCKISPRAATSGRPYPENVSRRGTPCGYPILTNRPFSFFGVPPPAWRSVLKIAPPCKNLPEGGHIGPPLPEHRQCRGAPAWAPSRLKPIFIFRGTTPAWPSVLKIAPQRCDALSIPETDDSNGSTLKQVACPCKIRVRCTSLRNPPHPHKAPLL